MYEFFEHTADLGLRMRANSLTELLAEAGRALFAAMVSQPEQIAVAQTVSLHVSGSREQPEYLLLDWLNELLFLFESRGLVCCRFDVSLDDQGLTAEVVGEPFDRERHGIGHEIKAITYHGLRVDAQVDGWLAEVIVDI